MSEETTTTKPQGLRKTRVGVVVSTKMAYAHDENETAKLGDKVRIRETRPLSALKRWELVEILKH